MRSSALPSKQKSNPRKEFSCKKPSSNPCLRPGKLSPHPARSPRPQRAGQTPLEFLARHVRGDWGSGLCEEDRRENEFSLERGFRLLSSYGTNVGNKIWIISEADRSSTFM